MVALQPTVLDLPCCLVRDIGSHFRTVHPVREAPHIRAVGNDRELDLSTSDPCERIDKVLVPWLVVQEDDRVMEPFVELLLQRSNRPDRPVYFAVAGKHKDGGVGAKALGVRLHALRSEWRV